MANSAIGLKSPIGLQDTRNVLINGEFNLWQRGTVAEAGFVGYGGIQNFHHADRWKLYGQSSRSGKGSTLPDVQASRVNFDLGDPIGTVNKSKYYLNLYVGNTSDLDNSGTLVDDSEPLSGFCGGTGAGNFIGIFQDIEDVRTLSGKSAILSYWAKSDITNQRIGAKLKQCFAGGTADLDVQGYTGAGHTLDNTWRQYKTEFNVPSVANQTIGTSGDDALQLGIYVHFCTGHGVGAASPALGLTFEFGNAAGASGNVSIAQVQLEQGTNATEFDKRSKAEEITDCQRFYEKSYDFSVNPGTVNSGQDLHDNAKGFVLTQGNPTSATPSLIFLGTQFSTRKRKVPTCTLYDPFPYTGGLGPENTLRAGNATRNAHSVATGESRISFVRMDQGDVGGSEIRLAYHYTADAELSVTTNT